MLELNQDELLHLQVPGALERRLLEMDASQAFRRIYVMGCGRSGTWLLTHVMATFADVEVVRKELPFEFFGLMVPSRSVLLLKRDHLAFRRIEQIPDSIEIAYIVRHPFDVLTSHLPDSRRPYHILPERWLGEMTALRFLWDSRRKNAKIIRYEDLVTSPRQVQIELANFFQFLVGVSIDDLYTISTNPTEAANHSARKIDTSSISKYKREPAKISYLKQIRAALGETLEWVGRTYHYDLSL
jgi:hypothetical protein